MSYVQEIRPDNLHALQRLTFGNAGVTAAVAAAEALLIVVVAVASGSGYHLAFYDDIGSMAAYAAFGILAALFYIVPFVGRGESVLSALLGGGRPLQQIALRWHVAFLLIAAVGFLTKTTGTFSRGWIALFFLIGLFGLLRLEKTVAHLLRSAIARGRVRARRLLLVGTDEDLATYRAKRSRGGQHDQIVSVLRLAPAQLDDSASARSSLAAALRSASDDARNLAIDDVLLLPATRRGHVLAACLDCFALLPVGVHLDAFSEFEASVPPKMETVGPVVALTLSASPAHPLEVIGKRLFDVVASGLALVVLSPLFLIVAALIKLDSRGPVFFLQRRRGYNLREFQIYKFRSMTTLEDGDHVQQARANDPRVTRVGRYLRKWSIDELPQLINVLKGEMSIVGPRPHAVAHDRFFETRIDRYARRLNVKPGITGWAQVNGFRGETNTDEKMGQRVSHDLYYIDNWSLPFDLYIIALTVTSPRTFTNAH